MVRRHLPQPFEIEEINFRRCFSARSFRHFVLLMTGWVLTVGQHTVSRVILTMRLHDSEHFGSDYRFLSRARWDPDHVAQILFRMMVDLFVPAEAEVVVVVDDTLNKHCGKKICGAGLQHDGSARKRDGQQGYGLCFVVIGLAVRWPGVSDRVFCLPFAGRLWWPSKAKVQPTELTRKTKPELGLELIRLTRDWLEPWRRLRVVIDISYCCRKIIMGRPEGVHITGRVRMDSSLYEVPLCPLRRPQGRPRVKGKRLPTPEAMCKDATLKWERTSVSRYGKEIEVDVHHFLAIWYHSARNEILSFLLVRDPSGTHADTVFFDTDPTASPRQIVAHYSSRWSIEITNRETKQLLGSADPQCRTEQAVIRTPLFAYWAYSFVVVWFIRQFSQGKRLVIEAGPWYGQKANTSFSDMLAAARRSHFTANFLTEAVQTRPLSTKHPARSTRPTQYTKMAKL